MKYNLDLLEQAEAAFEYLSKLVGKHAKVEVREIRPGRTLPQNNYLYLLLTAFGEHFGMTVDEAKDFYKEEICPDLYGYTKTVGTSGVERTFYRSTTKLDKDEMARSIDRLHEFSKKQGFPLPLATDEGWLMEIDNEIERSKYYLH